MTHSWFDRFAGIAHAKPPCGHITKYRTSRTDNTSLPNGYPWSNKYISSNPCFATDSYSTTPNRKIRFRIIMIACTNIAALRDHSIITYDDFSKTIQNHIVANPREVTNR